MATKSLIFALLTALFWGLAPSLAKAGLKGEMSPLAAVVVRSFGVFVDCTIVLTATGGPGALFRAGSACAREVAASSEAGAEEEQAGRNSLDCRIASNIPLTQKAIYVR